MAEPCFDGGWGGAAAGHLPTHIPSTPTPTQPPPPATDFGSCRGIYSKPPYTEYISTRWYRAPECLLTDGHYGHKMDVWGVGCVLFEVLALFPLFPGTNEADQIERIHKVRGCARACVSVGCVGG